MMEQPPAFAEISASNQHTMASQKLEHLLSALNRLKSDISGVEARHPGLGSDLSSLCDTVIADLNNIYSHNGSCQQTAGDTTDVTPDKQAAAPAIIPVVKHAANPVSSVIDKAGSYLITGLDKTGDGIIFVLEKFFAARVVQPKTGATAETDY